MSRSTGRDSLAAVKTQGRSWTEIGIYAHFTAVFRDGERICEPGHMVDGGPFEMAFDETNRIPYAASWTAGLLALKRD